MDAGDLVGGRFEIRHKAASGGMGIVFQAFDKETERLVALKVLPPQNETDETRFRREARLLDSLKHPGVVEYIASGTTEHGSPWMAIEWLEGEDLAARLRRQGLTIEESLTIAIRTASALGAAHARGIVHRDIKPANIFLVEKDPSQVKVLDFGIARSSQGTQGMTKTGVMIGTLAYMAPEQARGERQIDGRVDIFALGCVLFECLTGRQAFLGERPVAVLAKILFEDTPRLREVKPEISPALDELVAELMAKDPADRPSDATAVVRALRAMDPLTSASVPTRRSTDGSLTGGEQQVLSIILVSPSESEDRRDTATLLRGSVEDVLAPLRGLYEPLGVSVTSLASGQLLVTLSGCGTAKDQAARAAACALALRESGLALHVALATGTGEVVDRVPVGLVIDRVAALLDTATSLGRDVVLVDDVTAGLLDARFAVEPHQTGQHLLLGEREGLHSQHHLLGRPTTCVGRKRELAFLDGVLEESIEDEVASAVLVTARAGVGKSRLLGEFLRRAREHYDLTVMTSRGDPVYAGSSLSIATQIARSGLRLQGLSDGALPYAVIREEVGQLFEGQEALTISEFLGELAGAPSTEPSSPQAIAAQNDPQIRSEQLSSAFERWLIARCKRGPVLVVVEDLQWADLASLNYLDRCLRKHPDVPLMVIGLARPEVNEIYPDLWADAGLQKIGLSGLKRKAAEQLVKEVLGDDVGTDTIERVVKQAGGNAFYLEELIRHIAEHGSEEFPETVLAMAQSRLERLPAPARQILRAGAIFGAQFWQGGVCALLGGAMGPDDVEAWIAPLVEKEIIEPSHDGRFPGELEYAFRADLFRQTAYAMVTDADRAVGHRIAAEWLEEHGERSALALAEHFEKGGLTERAIPYFVAASQAALDGGNLDAALEISQRGLDAGTRGEARGELLLTQIARAIWTSEFSAIGPLANEALELLPEGSPQWFQVLAGFAVDGSFGGNQMAIIKVLGTLNSFDGALPAIGPVGYAAHAMNVALIFLGQSERSKQLFSRLEEAAAATETPDQIFMGYMQLLPVWLSMYGFLDLGEGLSRCERALQHFRAARSEMARAAARQAYGDMLMHSGDVVRCEASCHETIALAHSLGLDVIEGWSVWTLGFVQGLTGRIDEGLATLEPLLESGDSSLANSSRLACSMLALLDGRYDRAVEDANRVLDQSSFLPPRQAEARAVLASAAMARGDAETALLHAEASAEIRGRAGMQPLYASTAQASHIEALRALGRHEEAQAVLEAATARLRSQCDSLHDEEARRAFRENIPPNVRLAALAAD